MEVPDTEERLRWSLNRFLAAAAKKHSPAKIVIIIDGVNRLKGEASPTGKLHWLPSELPPCVRFIVSTTEFERPGKTTSSSKESKTSLDTQKPQNLHRTFVELTRRKCPLIRMEPLSVNTRHTIINEFISRHSGDLNLQESHYFKIVTAPTSAQPLFLRSLLQALRLSIKMSGSTVDHLLDSYLRCTSARDLIEKNLSLSRNAVWEDTSDQMRFQSIYSFIFLF